MPVDAPRVLTDGATSRMSAFAAPMGVRPRTRCIDEDVAWEPMDMAGSEPTEEVDAVACQTRCLDTQGCYHFTFWKVYGHCHLQDAFAIRRGDREGFSSGPFQCWDEVKDTGLVKVKNGDGYSFLPMEFNCMEVGKSFVPAMQLPKHFQGTETEMILQCQAACATKETCAHFSIDVASRTCHLSTAKAKALTGVLNSLAGPPSCDGSKEMVALQRKYSENLGSEAFWLPGAGSSLLTCLAGAALVGLVASASHFWRGAARRQGGGRSLLFTGDPQAGDAEEESVCPPNE